MPNGLERKHEFSRQGEKTLDFRSTDDENLASLMITGNTDNHAGNRNLF
jgi:hypothetical protein